MLRDDCVLSFSDQATSPLEGLDRRAKARATGTKVIWREREREREREKERDRERGRDFKSEIRMQPPALGAHSALLTEEFYVCIDIPRVTRKVTSSSPETRSCSKR